MSFCVEYLRKMSNKKRGASNTNVTCAKLEKNRSGGDCPHRQASQSGGTMGHGMNVIYFENRKPAGVPRFSPPTYSMISGYE